MDSAFPHAIINEGNLPSLAPSGGRASHFEFVGLLGRGGMAEVHEVVDSRTRRHIAVKRLFPQDDAEKRQKARRLFEREYHTLAQLAHPRIVQVYDYAVDDVGPYYTMELLSGGDLSQLVPMSWRDACRVAKDMCSALSLVHSRSMVHRDLSPRNVRCTADGTAKLIDFGAMAPMGRSKIGIVGTPAYCAPEVINGQVLDARTDLYALGATLFYALTGRHAYPAKDFASLPERWQFACPEPSELAPDVPKALDALVLELLRLDPLARPPSAFEVIARLCAIDGTAFDEQLVVARAYLSTPVLVGRSSALSGIQRRIHRTEKGRGRAVVIAGASGSGRTRFIEAAILEAKLRGASVVQADAIDGGEGEYGVVRALVRRLAAESKERVLAAAGDGLAALASVVPELAPDGAPGDDVSRADIQRALRDCLLGLAEKAPLVVAVDDFHAIDEPSAAALALIAHDARDQRLLVIASIDTGATPTAPAATKLFAGAADTLTLSPLTPDESAELLRSIFGDGPGVASLSHRLHDIARGNPRDTMDLAQHLVDKRVIGYERGAWSVPGAFDPGDLPSTMAQAMDTRFASLSPAARDVVCALALAPGEAIAPEEIALVAHETPSGSAPAVVDELLRNGALRTVGEHYALSQQGWARAAERALSESSVERLHLRLAQLFETRGNQDFRRGAHLLRAGRVDQALDVLVAHAALSQEQTGDDPALFWRYMLSLPPDWLEIYDEAIRLCVERGRPKKHVYSIRSRLGGMIGIMRCHDDVHSFTLVRELADMSGLSTYHAMDESIEPTTRLRTALGQAVQRHQARPESERVLDPSTAIRHFARSLTQVAGVITQALDVAGLASLPRVSPLSPISPAFGVIQMLLDGMNNRLTGRHEAARELYLALIERLGLPDGAGLDASHNEYTRLGIRNGIGMIEAGMGLVSALDCARELEMSPQSRVNAFQVKLLHELWQGNTVAADRLRHELELSRMQDTRSMLFEGTHLLWQVAAHGLAEDLTHLKRTVDEIAVPAARYPNWVPVQQYGKGEYHRAGGAFEAALAEFEQALAVTAAGVHQIWPYLAGAHVRVLDDLGRLEDAVLAGEKYLREAESAGLGYVTIYVLMPLAVVQAKRKKKDEAVALADRALSIVTNLGATGLNLGLAHEARARVAIAFADKQGYLEHLGRCRDVYTSTGNAALVTKFEKLRRSATARKPAASAAIGGGFQSMSVVGTSRLDLCAGPDARAGCALGMVMDQCGATAGVLYLVGAHGPFAAASAGTADDVLRSLALEYLESEASDVSTTGDGSSITTGDSQVDWTGSQGEKYRPILLTHESSEGFLVTGVAVVTMSPDVPFSYPSRVANEVSRHLRKMGDVTGIVVAG